MPTKIRAWDQKNKEMEYIDDLYWFEENGVHDFHYGQGHLTNYYFMFHFGRKDIHGRELYNNDIVRFFPKKGYEWLEMHGNIGMIFQEFEYMMLHFPDAKITPSFLLYYDFEYLGNTFENPELFTAGENK